MPLSFEVTVLVDNTAAQPGLATEHGLAFWIRAGSRHVLLDTGQGGVLEANASALGIDLARTDAVVLSHGHYDHTGGLAGLFDRGVTPPVFLHTDAFTARYSRQAEPPHKPIGMPQEARAALAARPERVRPVTGPTRIIEGVWATGPIPRRTAFEDTGGPFFTDAACRTPDYILDDQALWLETGEGVVVLLGCAHSGVVNTLDYLADVTCATQFRAVIGGMHLLHASEERLEATVTALHRYDIATLASCHCTGEAAKALLAQHFPSQFTSVGAGSRFEWGW